MLSGISNYLFGSSNQQQQQEKEKKQEKKQGQQQDRKQEHGDYAEDHQAAATDVDDNGEWLLVDSSGCMVGTDQSITTDDWLSVASTPDAATSISTILPPAPDNETTLDNLPTPGSASVLTVDVEDLPGCASANSNSTLSTPAKSDSSSDDLSDFERFRGPYLLMQDLESHSDAGLSDVSSQPERVSHPSMDECWIVTPPPCFTFSATSGRRYPVRSASERSAEPEANPLENLLIEHPSMSVYYPPAPLSQRRNVTLTPDNVALALAMTPSYDTPPPSIMTSSSSVDDRDCTADDEQSLSVSLDVDATDALSTDIGVLRDVEQAAARATPVMLRAAMRMGRDARHRWGVTTGDVGGGTTAAITEWKGKERAVRHNLTRSALNHCNRARLHDAAFKARRRDMRC